MHSHHISLKKSSGWKTSFVFITTILGLFFSESIYADGEVNNGRTQLQITATIVAKTCNVSANSKNKSIEMGRVAGKTFLNSDHSPPVVFYINLEKCSAATKGLKVTFSGDTDSKNNTLLALKGGDAAKNIGIAILDWNSQRLPIGQPSSFIPLESGSDEVAMKFYSQYVATGGGIIPGPANADATFAIEYQ